MPPDLNRVFHDLRNALGAVLLNLEVAADASVDRGFAAEASADALREARRLQEMIDALHESLRLPERG